MCISNGTCASVERTITTPKQTTIHKTCSPFSCSKYRLLLLLALDTVPTFVLVVAGSKHVHTLDFCHVNPVWIPCDSHVHFLCTLRARDAHTQYDHVCTTQTNLQRTSNTPTMKKCKNVNFKMRKHNSYQIPSMYGFRKLQVIWAPVLPKNSNEHGTKPMPRSRNKSQNNNRSYEASGIRKC